jgi:hypothetical protein
MILIFQFNNKLDPLPAIPAFPVVASTETNWVGKYKKI